MLKVELWLKRTSQPLVYEDVMNTYQKGKFYCVLGYDNIVIKYPIANIWRVKETYGYGSSDQSKDEG